MRKWKVVTPINEAKPRFVLDDGQIYSLAESDDKCWFYINVKNLEFIRESENSSDGYI